MPPVVNLARANVKVGSDIYKSARFVFHNGRAAVWIEDKSTRSAHRVLYATEAEFIRPKKGSDPMRLINGDTEWQIRNQGGCGCGSPTKKFTFAQLLDPDITDIG